MKTFKELSIGDTIYRVVESYQLCNPEKQQIEPILIKWLDLNDGKLRINEFRGYSNTDYLLIISEGFQSKTAMEFGKRLFFVNKEDANFMVRRAILEKINTLEKSIPTFVKNANDEIELLRSTFYEILNPSTNKDYKILASLS